MTADDADDTEDGGGEESDTDTPTREEIIANLIEQFKDLCHIHDHSTRVIANLGIDPDWFSDYDDPNRASYDLLSMIKAYLYEQLHNLSQNELERRIRGVTYLRLRFNLPSAFHQQIYSYTLRNRFTQRDKHILSQVIDAIKDICAEHDLLHDYEPALEPDELNAVENADDHILDAIQRASELGFEHFTANRANNAKYPIQAYLERQSYLNFTKAAVTTPSRRFARISPRDEVPCRSAHNRTLKLIADPDSQLTLTDFHADGRTPDWQRIRDEVLTAFHKGVEQQLDEIAGADRSGVREPVNAAIDITTIPFYPSPYQTAADAAPDATPVKINGDRIFLDPNYPELVSGIKQTNRRAYHFATLTIVADNTPIVLAIEPVRDKRKWEQNPPNTRTRGQLVNDLIEQAQQHVTIHKLFADRAFSSEETRHVINDHDIYYVLGKPNKADIDTENIEKTIDHDTANLSVQHATHSHNNHAHDITYIYKPTDTATPDPDYDRDDYVVFTVNAHVSPERAHGLISQYRHRWEIENQYKSIKANFLPKSATKDYRVRFLYFTLGVMLHNVWRLAIFSLRDQLDRDLGEDPPIQAGEVIEIIGFCLRDPGD